MSVLIIQNGIPCTKIEECIKNIFENIEIINVDKHKINQMNETEINHLHESIIGVIITGMLIDNKIDFFKDLYFSFQIDVINNCYKKNIPLLGIGIGCQLIGILYGLTQKQLLESRMGFGLLDLSSIDTKIIQNDNFLNKIDYNKLMTYSFGLGTYALHKQDDKDGQDLNIIAYDTQNNIHIIKHKNKQIYGFQDHFEIEPMAGIFFISISKQKNKKTIEKIEKIFEEHKQIKMNAENILTSFCEQIKKLII